MRVSAVGAERFGIQKTLRTLAASEDTPLPLSAPLRPALPVLNGPIPRAVKRCTSPPCHLGSLALGGQPPCREDTRPEQGPSGRNRGPGHY